MIKLDWSDMKSFFDTDQVSMKYVEKTDKYVIFGYDKEFSSITTIQKTSPANSDQSDFENNYKSNVNKTFRHRIYTHTFTETGAGSILDLSNNPMKNFAIKTTATGAVVSWLVALQINLENDSNFTTIATHTNTTVSGITLFVSSPSPALYLRASCGGLNLGLGTNITVKILGME